MSTADYLALDGWVTTDVETTAGADMKVKAGPRCGRKSCPHCDSTTDLVKFGARKRMIHDVPRGDQRVGIQVGHQRYKCKACGGLCYDILPHIDEKRAMTNRLKEHILNRSLDDRFTHVAGTTGLHERTIRNVFTDWRATQEAAFHVEVPRVLGLDEIHMGKVYHAILVNIEQRTILDLLKDREKTTLQYWFYERLGPSRSKIEIVTTDMYGAYRTLVKQMLPNAHHVVDKFHVLRMANYAVQEVRKHATRDQKVKTSLKNNHRLLDRRWDDPDWTTEQRWRVEIWFNQLPLLKAAYEAKERFYKFYDATSHPAASRAYLDWQHSLSKEVKPYFAPMMGSIGNWWAEIFAYFDYRYTNAATEGANSLIRTVESMTRGISFPVLRAKLLFAQDHKTAAKREPYDGWIGMMTGPYTPRPVQMVDYGVDISTLIEKYKGLLDEPGSTT